VPVGDRGKGVQEVLFVLLFCQRQTLYWQQHAQAPVLCCAKKLCKQEDARAPLRQQRRHAAYGGFECLSKDFLHCVHYPLTLVLHSLCQPPVMNCKVTCTLGFIIQHSSDRSFIIICHSVDRTVGV
jgi:hypothetical protein